MRIERLGPQHALHSFNSGVKVLDDWLVNYALENQRRDLSRTFVLIDDADEVIGNYSLTMGGVSKSDLPLGLGRGLPNFEIGMVLLGRLALATSFQGKGYGRDLMVDAIFNAAVAGHYAAARFISVDPIDQPARTLYEAFGFRDIPGDEQSRMFLRIDQALAAIENNRENL